MKHEQTEIIYVTKRLVSCDGSVVYSPHPLVYLNISKEKNEISCPYCSIKYVHKEPFFAELKKVNGEI